MDNWTDFLTAYNHSSNIIQRIVDGESIPNFVDELQKKYGFPDKGRADLASVISDGIVGIAGARVIEETLRTNAALKPHYSEAFATEVTQFVKGMADLDKKTPDPSVDGKTLDTVAPFRSMETDAKKIHGYGAFRGAEPVKEDQPVYRSEQAKLVPPPSYTDDSSTPRGT